MWPSVLFNGGFIVCMWMHGCVSVCCDKMSMNKAPAPSSHFLCSATLGYIVHINSTQSLVIILITEKKAFKSITDQTNRQANNNVFLQQKNNCLNCCFNLRCYFLQHDFWSNITECVHIHSVCKTCIKDKHSVVQKTTETFIDMIQLPYQSLVFRTDTIKRLGKSFYCCFQCSFQHTRHLHSGFN